MLKDVIIDTFHDSIGLLPFLFLAYLLIEVLEHKVGDVGNKKIRAAKKTGPIWGALFGVIPQCGFSAAAAGLYTRRVITMGTLIAVFLSTSDEMLPIFLSEAVDPLRILKILAVKAGIAAVSGILVDLFMKDSRKEEHGHSHHEHSHSHSHNKEEEIEGWKGLLWAAVRHTMEVFVYIVLVTFLLNLLVAAVGEAALARFLTGAPAISILLAVVVGLIPNCASSVVLTELYLGGILSAGAMMAGLLVNAGVGILVLFRLDKNKKETMALVGSISVLGCFWGSMIQLAGIVF